MKMSLRSKVVIYALLVMVAIYFLSPVRLHAVLHVQDIG